MSSLDQVQYDRDFAITHGDQRRIIYEPADFLKGLKGQWYDHNMMVIKQENLALANHFHDYTEVFFVPNDSFLFAMADNNECVPRVYEAKAGTRLVIPPYVSHRVIGRSNGVLRAWGNVPFDPKRLIPSEKDLIGILAKELEEAREKLWNENAGGGKGPSLHS